MPCRTLRFRAIEQLLFKIPHKALRWTLSQLAGILSEKDLSESIGKIADRVQNSRQKALQTMADPLVDWDYSWPKIGTLIKTKLSFERAGTLEVKRCEKYEKQPLANRSVTSH